MRVNPGYETLAAILQDALDQAQDGKGAERHADSRPFDQQPMQRLCELYGVGFALGQAGKKAQESQRMDYRAARRELLGAIVYTAGAILALDRQHQPANDNGERCSLPAYQGRELCSTCSRAGRCLEGAQHG